MLGLSEISERKDEHGVVNPENIDLISAASPKAQTHT